MWQTLNAYKMGNIEAMFIILGQRMDMDKRKKQAQNWRGGNNNHMIMAGSLIYGFDNLLTRQNGFINLLTRQKKMQKSF